MDESGVCKMAVNEISISRSENKSNYKSIAIASIIGTQKTVVMHQRIVRPQTTSHNGPAVQVTNPFAKLQLA